ncbi:hypothetical protein LWI29_017904 [Acer saccharum]|uniref:EF-hand domain-containing protein n=1 Tax=Acer saccharum TaxID=4024 RepID=A0AA39VDQ5_ACESA|nr:hypothetical protein LWI29_017904 [Acer saccharum]KAK1550277.1 hypothetical protein Q3G72_016617 [Acer saccharum]
MPIAIEKSSGCLSFVRRKGVRVPYTEAQLERMLMQFDGDRDGRLSKQDLTKALESLGSSFPAWRVWRALCHADEDGDGYISKDELNSLVKYIVKQGYDVSKWGGF